MITEGSEINDLARLVKPVMTVDEFQSLSKMPLRTIYAKFGTEEVRGVEFCGHKLIYL